MKFVLFFSFFRCSQCWFYWIMKYAGRIGTRMAKNWDNWKLLVAVLQPSSWHTQWNIWTWNKVMIDWNSDFWSKIHGVVTYMMGTSPIEASFASSVFRVIWNPSTASNYSQFFFNCKNESITVRLISKGKIKNLPNWYVFLQIVAFGSPPSSTVYFSFSCSSNKWVISADFWSQSTKAILKLEKGSPHLGSCLELHSQHLIAEPERKKKRRWCSTCHLIWL